MIEFPLGEDALRLIIENRIEYITSFLQFFTFLGEDEGYILIITFIYMVYDKSLAVRLAVIVLATMAINHLLKMIVGNPRPFVKEGTFMKKWLISPEYAQELASEFSTPSGHAMSSFTFYGYLYTIIHNLYFRIVVILTIVFVGISRPYLAVHFIEDIALGWLVGLIIVVLAIKYSDVIASLWKCLNLLKQLFFTVGISLTLWLITFYINGLDIASQPLPFVGHLGFILGVVLGSHLEQKFLHFNPKSKTLGIKIVRWLIAIVLVMTPLILLDEISKTYGSESTYLSHILHYLSYTLSGLLGIYIAPLLFLKLNLVDYFRE